MPNQDRPLTLVVIDDDDVDREVIVRSMASARIANPVETARDGVEGLDLLRGELAERPVVVILDWKMPRMNGLEFLEELRADPVMSGTPVFVLTTSDDEEDRLAAFDHMVAGYILKTRAGEDFMQLINLLQAFWNIEVGSV